MNEPTSSPARLAAWIRFGIGLLFSLAVLVACLVPLHRANTIALPLPKIEQGRFFELERPGWARVRPGDELPLYRFQENFLPELGRARVLEAQGNKLRCEVLTDTLLFPLGRHGKIADRFGDLINVELGKDHGFVPGDHLVVFQNHRPVITLRLIFPATVDVPSLARIEKITDAGRPLVDGPKQALRGLAVSEYQVETTVLLFSYRPWIVGLELAAILLIVGLETWVFLRRGYGLLAAGGRGAIRVWRRLPGSFALVLRQVAALAASAPVYWLVGSLLAVAVTFYAPLRPLGRYLPARLPWISLGVLLGAHLVLFAWRREHLLGFIWRWSAYRPGRLWPGLADRPRLRRALVWTLHLGVLYAFAFALIGFLAADVNVALDYLAPSSLKLRLNGASLAAPRTIGTWLYQTRVNLMHLFGTGVAHLSWDQTLAVVRYLVWALTILGSLVGYLHSLVHAFHWSSIRNVDFTPMGWLVNAVCYPPLLGVLFWLSVPYPYGAVPVVAHGPLFYLLGTVELGANVLYAASIWNMGIKFGVMVDKGLVDTGFFAVMRHPSYTLEGVMFFFICARSLGGLGTWIGACLPILLYWVRSRRDEVFMSASNPDYGAYRERVPYRFIPGLL